MATAAAGERTTATVSQGCPECGVESSPALRQLPHWWCSPEVLGRRQRLEVISTVIT